MRAWREWLGSLGLRWRLAGWVAAVMLICTGITFIAVYRGTAAQLRLQIDQDITGEAREMAHNMTLARARTPAQLALAADSYVSGQPFDASSTLLFAQVRGEPVATNRPELFSNSAPDDDETPQEQARENSLARQVLNAGVGYATLEFPDVGNLRLRKQVVHVPGGLQVTVGVGEPMAAVERAQRGVAKAFILAGILALAGALLGAYLVGTRVSRPLRQMAAVAARVDAGDLHPRIRNASGQGQEVRVLADAFNHMLDRLTAAFAGQRAFVADASHELRTPLTVIRGQLEVLAAQEHPSPEEVRRVEALAQAEIARISRLVDDLLLLAKSEQRQFLRVQAIDLRPYVEEIWDGMTLVPARRFELGELPDGELQADPDRLAQAVRNLLVNAIEHTRQVDGLVRMSVEAIAGSSLRFVVEDDGPGIPPAQREQVFARFYRVDAARDRASGGTGLGLAIVRAIALAHGGRVTVEGSSFGGARIEVELPRFTPARPRPGAAPLDEAAPAATTAAGDWHAPS